MFNHIHFYIQNRRKTSTDMQQAHHMICYPCQHILLWRYQTEEDYFTDNKNWQEICSHWILWKQRASVSFVEDKPSSQRTTTMRVENITLKQLLKSGACWQRCIWIWFRGPVPAHLRGLHSLYSGPATEQKWILAIHYSVFYKPTVVKV